MNEPEKTDIIAEETPVPEPENHQPPDGGTLPTPPTQEPEDTDGTDTAPEAEAVDLPGSVDPPTAASPEGGKPDPAEATEALKAQLLTVRAQHAALQVGVEPGRVELALKLADLTGIDAGAVDAQTKIEAALRKVLTDVPEFAVSRDTGGTGAHRRDSPGENLADTMAKAMGVKL